MTLTESVFAVWLHDRRVGMLHQHGDYTRFTLDDDYSADPRRPVLGLIFEQDLLARHTAHMRLPPWFSNLLPEGVQRKWIATDREVSPDREMELLAQVGHDLPGAVRVVPADEAGVNLAWDMAPKPKKADPADEDWHRLKFSLAGVTLKFSMVSEGERLTLPARGQGGDWIVKLPDARHRHVPANEYTMMSLAAASGIQVPEVKLVHRDQIEGLPGELWPHREQWAYAVRRFDRDDQRRLVHIEDLAQVRNFYPDPTWKYSGNFETVAGLIYRRRDLPALREFARRLAFNILISNGDAHLKNWSLIYRDPRVPTLSPAYDLVSTAHYMEKEDLGLKFGGSRRFENATLATFARLERRLDANGAELVDQVTELVEKTRLNWPRFAEHLDGVPDLQSDITDSIERHRRTLLRTRN
ncbi:type II toxin-antitoxin system HipA family toxin [Amycolatopsis anabasis]|uniref:type II toxin-antitoxin system HipA family toxin n=1 Tax=Amycolatopsis anabasis TaxID=1840409 RepID=UPI00131D8557|nr:HipA domain-containing protein [Amycolatopsis anabasis]